MLISQLILQCLEAGPKNRPSMEQVLETLENAQTSKYKPKVKKIKKWTTSKVRDQNSILPKALLFVPLVVLTHLSEMHNVPKIRKLNSRRNQNEITIKS